MMCAASSSRSFAHLSLCYVFVWLVISCQLQAQIQPASRITEPIDDRIRTTLQGNVHPLAQSRFDQGVVGDSFPAERMLLLLQRSPDREAALQQFLQEAHRPGSPSYHRWLTPEQFGKLYGPSDSEIAAVRGWLEAQGFSVSRVTEGRTALEFSGTAGQVRSAFRTEIHAYVVRGEKHYANNLDPQIPTALAPVISGITPMNDFQPTPYVRDMGKAVYDRNAHKFVPQWTFPNGNNALEFDPADFALQYDLTPLYSAGIKGTGITIGLIGASNVDPSVVATYRSFFGLPARALNVVIDGLDPGQNYALTESYLDVELAGAVAPGASITLYTSAGTSVQSGLNLAAIRAVDEDVASVLSTSYGTCEQNLGSSGNQFWYSLWEQAAAQGQTSFVSAGDGGPAGCDNFNNFQPAQFGIAMNGFSSTPWNVSVGGTDFYYTSYNADATAQQKELNSYWDTVATIFPTTSLQQSVPEQPWNQPFGLNLATGGVYSSSDPSIVAGSGGPSNCAIGTNASNGTYSSCTAGYPKPAWQTGEGVPNDGVRDLPDVSLFAAAGQNDTFYPICTGPYDCVISDGDLTISIVGGTSASSPAMAGIMALIDQKYGPQGQADFTLYPMAAQHASAFHDVTVGSNVVPCQVSTPDCTLSTATDNTKGFDAFGFDAGPGYDLATGLGSVDADQLFNNWNSLTFKSTSTHLNLSQATFPHGTPITVNVGVSGSGGTPTGSVALVTTATPQGNVGVTALTLQDGAGTGSVNTLPGGRYKVTGRYSGDNFFASSNSTAVNVNVTAEGSTLSLFGTYFNYNDGTGGTLAAGASYPYGTSIAIEAQAVGVNASPGSTDGVATGTVVFSDAASSGTASSGALNMGTSSTAAWVPNGFSVGTHNLSATYSGDASFNASSSNAPLNFTITKATPVVSLTQGYSASGQTVGLGQSVPLIAEVGIYSPAPPATGTVTFYSGTTLLGPAPLQASQVFGASFPVATLNVTTLPLGNNTVSAHYSGDANFEAVSSNSLTIPVMQAAMVSATATPSSLVATASFTVTVNVSAPSGQPAPTGNAGIYADGPGGSWSTGGGLTGGSFSFTFPGSYWSPGTVSANVSYSGDSNYAPSNILVPVTMLNPYTMKASSPVSFAAGATAGNASTLTVTPVNGFSGPVYFACTIAYYPPGAQHLPTCSVPKSVNVTAASAVTVSMAITSTPPTTTTSSNQATNTHRWFAVQAATLIVGILVVGLPFRKRTRSKIVGPLLLVLLIGSIGLLSCGGGGGNSTSNGNTIPGTTAGTYKFEVASSYTPNVGLTQPLFSTQPQVSVVTVNIQ